MMAYSNSQRDLTWSAVKQSWEFATLTSNGCNALQHSIDNTEKDKRQDGKVQDKQVNCQLDHILCYGHPV